ncbi:hypothetical protein EV356DRAFT_524585 [Viridothelium virens]|uniref:Guanine nucleotide exchange factor synembryn n=1 Tax=Viridothelium virens TaxID=1048519 RepID=A0A6A6H5X1_VIRVR|nr:hypothetical protein EV356DRAFT_524585 [Viridothelium virens]
MLAHTRSHSGSSKGSYTTSLAPSLTGEAKLNEVTTLLIKLRHDLRTQLLEPQQRVAILDRLKVYSRDATNADPMFEQEGINTLSEHAFSGKDQTSSREALRCLANAFLLQPKSRQIFVNKGYGPKAAERYKGRRFIPINLDNRDDEFLLGRILFLMTYDTTLNFEDLIKNIHLDESINEAMARHAKAYSKSRKSLPAQADEMALTETCKLIFNILYYYPDLAENFSASIPHIFKILTRIGVLKPPLQAPVNTLINALIPLDLENKKSKHLGINPVFPKFDQNHNIELLIDILHQAITSYKEDDLDHIAAPVLNLIRKIYGFAPDGVRRYMQWLMLPTDADRKKPLGQLDTLSARLLRLSTSPMLPTMRESISALMFELSDNDANKFVHNVGYGFASGFLLSHNIAVPQTASDAFSSPGDTGAPAINPITGQRLDMEEPHDTGPEMTQEEKEREAEKLFVLFERLKKTGVVNVKNPVEHAVEEGRFEELD